MLDQGWIDQAAHDEALADDVYSRIQNVNTRIEETNTVNSYFVDALSEQLIEDLTSEDGLGYSQTPVSYTHLPDKALLPVLLL